MDDTNANNLKWKRVIVAGVIIVLILSGSLIYNHNQNKTRARLAAELAAQYKTAANAKKPAANVAAVNGQKTFILDFYNAYLANKKSNKAQSEVLVKYGTANLETLYKSSTAANDNIVCGAQANLSDSAISIGEPLAIDADQKMYPVTFRDAKLNVQAAPQVTLLSQGASYRIDRIGCLGPV